MTEEEIIKQAVDVLKNGGLILYPTDTIWGIGCDATNEQAVAKVYKLKKRDDSKSLVILADGLDMVARYVKEIPSIAIDLVEVNDVPMTIIYPQAQGLASNAVACDGSVGIRIPLNNFCLKLIGKLRRPIVSTSANISGQNAAASFAEISREIKDGVDYIVDSSLEKGCTGKASQILKVGLKGEIQIIRA